VILPSCSSGLWDSKLLTSELNIPWGCGQDLKQGRKSIQWHRNISKKKKRMLNSRRSIGILQLITRNMQRRRARIYVTSWSAWKVMKKSKLSKTRLFGRPTRSVWLHRKQRSLFRIHVTHALHPPLITFVLPHSQHPLLVSFIYASSFRRYQTYLNSRFHLYFNDTHDLYFPSSFPFSL